MPPVNTFSNTSISKKPRKSLSIGKVAARTGLSISAIRYYETEGLVHCGRTSGGKRVLSPSDIRRLSFIMIAQGLGFSLKQIKLQLDNLPEGRTPTKKDWDTISRSFSKQIDARIIALQALREKLTGCIGCGCLSLKTCNLYNADDKASTRGVGPRYLMGDQPL